MGQCNKWCSQNMLLIDLIITAFSPWPRWVDIICGSCKQPCTESKTYVGLSASSYYTLWHKSYKMNNNNLYLGITHRECLQNMREKWNSRTSLRTSARFCTPFPVRIWPNPSPSLRTSFIGLVKRGGQRLWISSCYITCGCYRLSLLPVSVRLESPARSRSSTTLSTSVRWNYNGRQTFVCGSFVVGVGNRGWPNPNRACPAKDKEDRLLRVWNDIWKGFCGGGVIVACDWKLPASCVAFDLPTYCWTDLWSVAQTPWLPIARTW